MSNPDRHFDKTYLSIDQAEERGLIHRDYIAHCFRWSHVVKHLYSKKNYELAVVLDVGCGKEVPLAKTMYVNKMTPLHYVGVDMNKFEAPEMLTKTGKFPLRLIQQRDVTTLELSEFGWMNDNGEGVSYIKPNVITCFEVLEHVRPGHARKILEFFRDNLDETDEQSRIFVSTPCWNGSAAANHINEMTYEALYSMIESVGLRIVGRWGTFASISDIKHLVELDGLQPYFERMREYYDTNVLATMMAPLYPQASRNVLWELKLNEVGVPANPDLLFAGVQHPWSQHPDYLDMAGPMGLLSNEILVHKR